MTEYADVFKPIRIGPILLKNRIGVAPAAPFLASHTKGVSPEFYAYTENLARSGAALITLGVTDVGPGVNTGARTMSAGNDLYLPDLGEIADCIHIHDAAAGIELVYSRYMLMPADKVVNQTSTEEVEAIIDCFAQAAGRARRAGFDVVMIHGGHGNVPAMFFNEKINKRSDRFGGSFEGRCRFGVELLDAVRKAVEGKLAIEYRISAEEILPGMTTIEQTLDYARVIQHQIDLLHVSRGMLEVTELLPYINVPLYLPRGINLPYAARFKRELEVPITVVGGFDLTLAQQAIAAGEVDMVSMIRTVLADTDCVEKARLGMGKKIRPCIRCNTCIDRTHTDRVAIQCAVNPILGRETRFEKGMATRPKRVAIIGGGVAGLEAARVCARRGHIVDLYEKQDRLGGLFNMACSAKFKQELRTYLDWSIQDVELNNDISIHLNTEITPEQIRSIKPDALVIAVGAKAITPRFSASDSGKVVWVGDVECGCKPVGDTVVIAGAGVTGLECALELSNAGKKVTLVDLLPRAQIGVGGTTINLILLFDLLKDNGVELICQSRVLDIDDNGVLIESTDGTQKILPCDTAILSLGFKPDPEALSPLMGLIEPTYLIGDCSPRGGTLHRATRSAFEKCMQI